MIARLVWLQLVLGASIAAGCAGISEDSAGIDDDFMDDPPPPGGCDTECNASGTAGSPLDGPCLSTSDCAQGICVATFDGEVQDFTCQASCVPVMDDTRWCADDQSCCDGATCSARGYCLPSALDGTGSDGSDSGSTGGSDSSGTGSGTDSGGTGSGTDSSGGSSSTG